MSFEMNEPQNQNFFGLFRAIHLSFSPFEPFYRLKWQMSLPFHLLQPAQITANYHETSLEQSGQQQLINCRVSFIDLYLVFPRNFRMIFLPHTNTVILLEPYCGTITEPGLPVVYLGRCRYMVANQVIRALFVYSLALFYGFMVCFFLLLSAIRKVEIPRRGKRREKRK